MKNEKCKVVMLSTEKATNIFKRSSDNKLIHKDKSHTYNYVHLKGQYLYILSDEGIKEGDWCYVNWGINISGNELYSISKCDKIGLTGIHYFNDLSMCWGKHELKAKKVIATTDESLGLPRPSNEFLQAYCRLGVIDEVEVEYEREVINIPSSVDNRGDYEGKCPICKKYYNWMGTGGMTCYQGDHFKLKVAPDNTITIKPIKDSWNREEVENLIRNWASYSCTGKGQYWKADDLDNWIKQNL